MREKTGRMRGGAREKGGERRGSMKGKYGENREVEDGVVVSIFVPLGVETVLGEEVAIRQNRQVG